MYYLKTQGLPALSLNVDTSFNFVAALSLFVWIEKSKNVTVTNPNISSIWSCCGCQTYPASRISIKAPSSHPKVYSSFGRAPTKEGKSPSLHTMAEECNSQL